MSDSLSDACLLERFVSDREEAAFVALVRRHGPRVQRICRRILRDEHDIEDVFQATFLVLARKAAGIAWQPSVSPWLDGVARRLALHARSDSARHRRRELPLTMLADGPERGDGRLPERMHPSVEPSAEAERRDLRRVLDDELRRLPEKYRAPLVLCDLEGHTREEAARQLGWPAGSMSRRLDRGRSLLRVRLTHRGVALGLIGLACLTLALGHGPDRPEPAPSVRQVMATFQSPRNGRDGDGYGSILAGVARGGDTRPDFDRVRPAARAAVAAAIRIEGARPGSWSPLWDRFADNMRDSAVELERACERSDGVALVAAARRLDASCVNCHAVFGRGNATDTGRVSIRPAPSPIPDHPGPARCESIAVGNASPTRVPTAGTCRTRPVPHPGELGRLPGSAAVGVFRLASNERQYAAVETMGPDRRRILPGSGFPVIGPRPPDGGPRRPPDARAGPAESRAC